MTKTSIPTMCGKDLRQDGSDQNGSWTLGTPTDNDPSMYWDDWVALAREIIAEDERRDQEVAS